MTNNKRIKSAAQALKESQALKSIWSEESRVTQRILIYMCELLEGHRLTRKQSKPSKWQQHVTKYLRSGKTIKDASADWNKSKP